MRIRKILPLVFIGVLPVVALSANTQRSTYGFETRFPDLGHVEGGADIRFEEIEIYNDGVIHQNYRRTSYGAYARYGLLENLTASARVPLVDSDPDPGSSEVGLGDINLGLQLLAFQDIFDYPFIIPHINVSLPTGEEDSGTGEGEAVLSYGISIGTKTWGWLTWILDGTYEAHEDIDDVLVGSVSLIADVSRDLSFVGEVQVNDQPSTTSNDFSANVLAGIAYNWSRNFTTLFSVGGAIDEGDDFQSVIRMGYSW